MIKIFKYGFYRYLKAIFILVILVGGFFFAYKNELLNFEAIVLYILFAIFLTILVWWQLSSQIILKEGIITIKCFGMTIKEMKINNTIFKLNGYEDPNAHRSLTNKSEPYYCISTTDKNSKEHYKIKIYDKKDYLNFSSVLKKIVKLT